MKKLWTTTTVATITALIVSCGGPLLVPTQADADRVASKYSGYTLAELRTGKADYEKYCITCHGLKKPEKFTELQWNVIVPEMVKKANKREKVVDEETQESILRYLVTMSGATRSK